jgi:uncharacterized glyoxalase superfamily protein PhnB
MKIQSFSPNLMVYDVQETVDYYKELLDFELVQSVPDENGVLQWAMMKKEEFIIMFQEMNSLQMDIPFFKEISPGGSLNFYIKIDNIQAFYDNIKESYRLVSELDKTFYNTKEFSISDINGYILTFAEDL